MVMLSRSNSGDRVGRFHPHLQHFVVVGAAVTGLGLSAPLPGRSGHFVRGPQLPAPSVTGASPSAPVAPRSTAATPPARPAVGRYKLLLSTNPYINEETWLVFDLIPDTTFILWKHATTDGLHWWDHPLSFAQVCRIAQADDGERLMDCVRAASPGGGEPLRIVMPAGACRQDCLLTFSWIESGRSQEWMIRLDHTQQPAVIAPLRLEAPGSDHQRWQYKIKLSPGSASTNLRPESWVVVNVSHAPAGTSVSLRHSTNAMNLITGFSRWWDHPILASRACPLFPTPGQEGSQGNGGCRSGTNPAPGEPLRIQLPAGTSIHDYRFAFSWRENNRIQEAVFVIDRLQPAAACPQCR